MDLVQLLWYLGSTRKPSEGAEQPVCAAARSSLPAPRLCLSPWRCPRAEGFLGVLEQKQAETLPPRPPSGVWLLHQAPSPRPCVPLPWPEMAALEVHTEW